MSLNLTILLSTLKKLKIVELILLTNNPTLIIVSYNLINRFLVLLLIDIYNKDILNEYT